MDDLLSLEQAAAYLGMSEEALLMYRYRGLPPGSLGRKSYPGGPLVWSLSELFPAPKAKFDGYSNSNEEE